MQKQRGKNNHELKDVRKCFKKKRSNVSFFSCGNSLHNNKVHHNSRARVFLLQYLS